jgi:hypothetical protein
MAAKDDDRNTSTVSRSKSQYHMQQQHPQQQQQTSGHKANKQSVYGPYQPGPIQLNGGAGACGMHPMAMLPPYVRQNYLPPSHYAHPAGNMVGVPVQPFNPNSVTSTGTFLPPAHTLNVNMNIPYPHPTTQPPAAPIYLIRPQSEYPMPPNASAATGIQGGSGQSGPVLQRFQSTPTLFPSHYLMSHQQFPYLYTHIHPNVFYSIDLRLLDYYEYNPSYPVRKPITLEILSADSYDAEQEQLAIQQEKQKQQQLAAQQQQQQQQQGLGRGVYGTLNQSLSLSDDHLVSIIAIVYHDCLSVFFL